MRFDPHCTINSLSLNCLTCDYSQYTYTLKYNNGNKLKLKKNEKVKEKCWVKEKMSEEFESYKNVFTESE